MAYSVCIFAHNEAKSLPGCVAALQSAGMRNHKAEIHILENGSTDSTLKVARVLAAADPAITIHELPVADKTNAWNTYVHCLAPNAPFHFFIDGDIIPCKDSFSNLADAILKNPNSYAAAAIPAAGRSRQAWANRTLQERHINGNLYALNGEVISRLRQSKIRMPFGSVGEDGLLRYILATDLAGGRDDSHDFRIAVAPDALFAFSSLQLNSIDLATYTKRLKRYSKRYFQNKILYPLLKDRGICAMPDCINEIYSYETLKGLHPRLSPENFAIDVQTLKKLRKIAKSNIS